MTSLPQAPHVKDVFLNPDTGLLASTKLPSRKILFLELSTIDSSASAEVADAVNLRGFGDFVDAPCSVRPYSLSNCLPA
jgi:3-hydroxyisobutyrate dehydrogenase